MSFKGRESLGRRSNLFLEGAETTVGVTKSGTMPLFETHKDVDIKVLGVLGGVWAGLGVHESGGRSSVGFPSGGEFWQRAQTALMILGEKGSSGRRNVTGKG